MSFTPRALAAIFLGSVKRWNDPEIARANASVKLPARDIVVVHRSDGSGTSFIWTDYLAKVNADWKTKVGAGAAVNWPVGLGAKGNEGVSGLVKQTPYSIGYVELVYALQNRLAYGLVQNASGTFVKADLASVTAAAASAGVPDDFRVSITNASGADAYPIASFTWLLITEKIEDGAKRQALVEFLGWMLKEGQSMSEAFGYARLPAAIVSRELNTISQIH